MVSDGVIAALITGGISLIGTILTIVLSNKKTNENLKISQAVMDAKLEALTREVRLHNSFVTRVPVLEEKVTNLEKIVR